MSVAGHYKGQLTRAINTLKRKIAEVDPALFEQFDLSGDPGEIKSALFNHKSFLLFTSRSLQHSLDTLQQRWERAERLAESQPDESGELPLLDEFQAHRDASDGDELVGETEALIDRLQLPSLELPESNGEFEAFPEFWDIFNTAVHSNDTVPPSLKFLHLKSKLTGSAASTISEIKCTAQNYDEAITTLLATYDRPDILRQKFWDQLQALPPSAGSAMSQRTLVCKVRAIWAQLKNLKEQPGSTPLMRMILSKFPQRTHDKVGELRNKNE
ncbi:hypothetical protein ANCCAN_22144 [Ancylostoma caninum]|uniref:Uncharacterized protein n=1 Tax=Ancylostoma caninum TaxID=29170 RepID=A0A368FKL4_ANCCA|nr:hypothetical protein ANCCAN_22144 [Ancylostoma caninum]